MANRVIGEIERLFAEHPDAGPHEMLTALNRYVRLTMAKSAVYATAASILYQRFTVLQRDWKTLPATLDQLGKDRACLAAILQ